MICAHGRSQLAMTAAGSVHTENGLAHENNTNCNVISLQLRLKNFLNSFNIFGKRGAKISNDFDLDCFRDQKLLLCNYVCLR